MINLKHNPNLIKIDEAPNGNVIYHIYSDGEITSEKGGGVYGQRSRFTQTHPISQTNHIRLSNYDIFKFPLTDGYNNKYAIYLQFGTIDGLKSYYIDRSKRTSSGFEFELWNKHYDSDSFSRIPSINKSKKIFEKIINS